MTFSTAARTLLIALKPNPMVRISPAMKKEVQPALPICASKPHTSRPCASLQFGENGLRSRTIEPGKTVPSSMKIEPALIIGSGMKAFSRKSRQGDGEQEISEKQ